MMIDRNFLKSIVFLAVFVALFSILPESAHANIDLGDFNDFFNGGNGHGSSSVPEFGLGAAAAAGAVLAGGISVLFGRRKKHH